MESLEGFARDIISYKLLLLLLELSYYIVISLNMIVINNFYFRVHDR